ncbi:hypothetical protein BMS3Abin04_02345 [bacterium BMS3Abin04]|nr:hypothetical protein BMS3Abin04_02345 [bacterium BMS3Abin04]
MKNIKKIFYLVLLFSFASVSIYSQKNDDKSVVKASLNKIFELSKSNKYQEAAKLFAYKGNDKTRSFKSTFDYSKRIEKSQVRRNCKKIKAYLDLSDSFEYDGFTTKKIDGILNYILNVKFKSGSQSLNITFKFVKINGKFVLADFG